jgi:hypothetical protein
LVQKYRVTRPTGRPTFEGRKYENDPEEVWLDIEV